ncbi:hypothetical protein P7G58_02070 [Globicatella sulfidifaciens]|uniref:hypothetical protein n=1 Tax=Globicatella sulfidifaciens TaxID=136093 RepID=UPI0028922090|nr:hypothetical protein [Globicatella sulfidifaciens]MDT2767654.1 hypothetical protein [Globicatella sulfidifaciens]
MVTTILANIRIENKVIIGAGSLVKSHLKSNGIFVGVSSRRIDEFDTSLKMRKMVMRNLLLIHLNMLERFL